MRARTIAVWLTTVALLLTGAVAGAAANNRGGSPSSTAELSITFSEDCRTVTVTSDKDISYVRAHFSEFPGDPEDNRTRGEWDYINEDSGELNPSPFVVTFDDPVVIAQAKAGTTVVTEECDPEPKPECSDGENNDDDPWTDFPDDPGCDGPDDETEDPNPECSDGVDNDDAEDELADADDPGCHTDGDPDDGDDTYDPRDDDETDDCLSEDSDGDGVNDCDDQCPDTEQGATVDEAGCPTGCERGNDADGDGVDDCDDLCPNEGEMGAVDEDGCPIQVEPTLTCRANLIAAALGGNALPNLFEANAPSNPCASEQAGLLVTLSPILGDGGAGLLDDDNRLVLADPSGNIPGSITIDAAWADTTASDGAADADSGVLFLAINDGSDDQIVVEAVTSRSHTGQSGDACTQETEAHVVKVTIAGNEIPITGAHTPLITPELYDVIELHLEDAGDGANEGPDDTGAQAVDASALMDNVLAGLADSETGCA